MAAKKFIDVLLVLLRGTVHALSGEVSTCRFEPTCSNYAREAFHVHSLGGALRLVLIRFSRCLPGGGFGHDPVPPLMGANNGQ